MVPGPLVDIACSFDLQAFQTRKVHARMGVVSSSSSDPDGTDWAPVSRACVSGAYHRKYPERYDQAYRRVSLNEAEQAPWVSRGPKCVSEMLEKSAAEVNSLLDQGKRRSYRGRIPRVCDETVESLVDQTVEVEPQLRQDQFCT